MEVYIIIKSLSNHLEGGEGRRFLNLSISLSDDPNISSNL
jgi:hypothetical protein